LVGGIGGPLLFNWIWGDQEADPETASKGKSIMMGLTPTAGGAGIQAVLRF
jgi:hypothetical protein